MAAQGCTRPLPPETVGIAVRAAASRREGVRTDGRQVWARSWRSTLRRPATSQDGASTRRASLTAAPSGNTPGISGEATIAFAPWACLRAVTPCSPRSAAALPLQRLVSLGRSRTLFAWSAGTEARSVTMPAPKRSTATASTDPSVRLRALLRPEGEGRMPAPPRPTPGASRPAAPTSGIAREPLSSSTSVTGAPERLDRAFAEEAQPSRCKRTCPSL